VLSIHLSWWFFCFIVQAVIVHRFGFDWQTSFLDAAASNLLLAAASFITMVQFRFFQAGVWTRIYRVIFALATLSFYFIALEYVLKEIIRLPEYQVFFETSVPIRASVSFLQMVVITLLSWLLGVLAAEKIRESKNLKSAQLLRDAELMSLRGQFQPHFIFNSLNSIGSLTISKPQEAMRMIQLLSEFLRGNLQRERAGIGTLKEEIEQVKRYLEIEKVRFGERLKVDVKVNPDHLGAKIPTLILQPVIENAVKHGLYETLGEVYIHVKADGYGENVELTVTNPCDENGQTEKGTGWGLDSIARRLFLLYSRNDLLRAGAKEGVFTTTIVIPAHR
jgi:two-component system LytT family sensor kinase